MILDDGFGLDYLFKYHEGKIQMGLGVGVELIDNHIRYKNGEFVMINGLDNVGKTRWILWYFLVLSLKHGLKWVIWSGENKTEQLKRDLIQMMLMTKFKDVEYSKISLYLMQIDQWFKFVNINELYNHKQLLRLFEKEEVNGRLIDPFTGINHDRGLNMFERNYVFCNDIRNFCNRTGKSVYVNTHPQTEAARRTYPNDSLLSGYIQAPKKSDVEGGQAFANRADSFLTIHRLTNNPNLWMQTEVHVRKIKDTETGGKNTFMDEPLRFDYNEGLGFTIGGHNAIKNI